MHHKFSLNLKCAKYIMELFDNCLRDKYLWAYSFICAKHSMTQAFIDNFIRTKYEIYFMWVQCLSLKL